MPQLDATQYAKFCSILDDLGPILDDLTGASQGFVSDQIARNNEYGARTFVSEKQMAWLERLHEEHIGTSDFKAENGDPGPSEDDINDDIPF